MTIDIRSTTVFRGPNIWARMPAILMEVDIGELEERPTNKIPGFYEHLTELLPGLYEHSCSVGKPGVPATPARGTGWGTSSSTWL